MSKQQPCQHYKVGDNVIVTRDVSTSNGCIEKGSTGTIIDLDDDIYNPSILVRMSEVKGSNLVGESIFFYKKSLSFMSTISNPDTTGPDEKELRRRRDEQLGRLLGF